MIGGVPLDAPLWRGTAEPALHEIVARLTAASFHYADDSTREWGLAREALAQAARSINQHRLGMQAIRALHRDRAQLVDLDQLLDAVLRDAREAAR